MAQDFDQFIDQFQSPEAAVTWAVLNRAYHKPDDYHEKYQAASKQEDTTRALAVDLYKNQSAACANFAALAAYTARKKGIPGGVIYVKQPGMEVGHDYAFWKSKNGSVVLASNNKIEKVYPNFMDFAMTMGAIKGQKNSLVYVSDQRGKLITDPQQEKAYLIELAKNMTGGIQPSVKQPDQHEALRDSEGIDYLSR